MNLIFFRKEQKIDQPIDDSAIENDMFGFLEELHYSNSDVPPQVWSHRTFRNPDVIMGVPVTSEDLSEFKFVKSATTYTSREPPVEEASELLAVATTNAWRSAGEIIKMLFNISIISPVSSECDSQICFK